MRFILPILLFVFSASIVYAQDRAAPYSGFSDDFVIKNGGAYKSAVPNAAELDKNEAQRKANAEKERAEREARQRNWRNHGFEIHKDVIWNSPYYGQPSPYGFLSPCQASVQSTLNDRSGRNDEIVFSGNPISGQAIDRQGQRFNYSCQGKVTYIW